MYSDIRAIPSYLVKRLQRELMQLMVSLISLSLIYVSSLNG